MILCPQAQIEQGVGGLSTGILVRATLKSHSLFSCHTDTASSRQVSNGLQLQKVPVMCLGCLFFFSLWEVSI